MANYYLAPVVHKTWFVPGGNSPASGGQLFTYVAGSSTKTTVYKDALGNSSHTNPIVLDSGGNLPSGSEVWIPTGVTIDIVFAPSNDTDPPVSPYDTYEDISGINDVNAAASEWVEGPTPAFVSGTQFVLQGDQSSTFKNGRRIRSTNTGGTVYGRITSIVAASGSTTVNTVSDSGNLDSGLSAVAYGLLDPQNVSINEYHVDKDGGSVASAGNATTNIWGVAGKSIHVTGTNTIACFSSAAYAGAERNLIFDGALTLQSSAAFLSTPTQPGRTLTTAAGDRAKVVASTAAHAVITQYQRGDGRAITQSMEFIASTVAASSATVDIVFSTVAFSSFPSYLLTISNMKIATDGQGLAVRVSEDGGGTFNASSTAYLYSSMWLDSNNSAMGAATTAAAGNMLASQVSDGIGNAAAEDYAGTIRFFAPHNTICHKRFLIDATHALPSGVSTRISAHGTYSSTSAFNAIRFLATSGNINSGKFVLYGLRDI